MHIFKPQKFGRLDSPERYERYNPAELIYNLDIPTDAVCADLGCGTGFFTIPMSKMVRMVYAIDKSGKMLKTLRDKIERSNISNIEVRLAQVEDTRLEEGSVDLAFIAEAFHEIKNRSLFLSEVKRILKSEGRFVIVDWHKRKTPGGPPLKSRIDSQEVAQIIRNNGFLITKVEDWKETHYIVDSIKPAHSGMMNLNNSKQ
ncbi:MAG: class I SAM-dependent methyltransferase [bacterium]